MSAEVNNGKRAEWAAECVSKFQQLTGTDKEDAVADLVCDLMHWCSREKQDPMNEVERGIRNYICETMPYTGWGLPAGEPSVEITTSHSPRKWRANGGRD
jgi:hypothetical protein